MDNEQRKQNHTPRRDLASFHRYYEFCRGRRLSITVFLQATFTSGLARPKASNNLVGRSNRRDGWISYRPPTFCTFLSDLYSPDQVETSAPKPEPNESPLSPKSPVPKGMAFVRFGSGSGSLDEVSAVHEVSDCCRAWLNCAAESTTLARWHLLQTEAPIILLCRDVIGTSSVDIAVQSIASFIIFWASGYSPRIISILLTSPYLHNYSHHHYGFSLIASRFNQASSGR
ncbi:hypothetical protein F5Y06DRAFT_89183 [Hypoxylon sp. FL0890]|nr:hypothetical protein F5Y06DRAFT_89183 [Hypoxylon sp. FL0890]